MYIVFEGPWGSGKSTQAKKTVEYLKKLFPKKEIIYTREPGGSEVAEEIRKVVLSTKFTEKVLPLTDIYLFAASRAQTLRTVVKPVLEKGGIVVADSSFITSLSIQGGAQKATFEKVLEINRAAVEDLLPDYVIYIDVDVEQAGKRTFDASGDKFENEDLEFGKRRVAAYKLASKLPMLKKKWIQIEGTGDIEEVFSRIQKELDALFDSHSGSTGLFS